MSTKNAAISSDEGSSKDHPSGPGGPLQSADDQRAAPRFTLLIRAAKLISPNGEFVCVIRDVSEKGISIRLFHALPSGSPLELQMPTGGSYRVETVYARDNEVGFQFSESVDVSRLISEAGEYPKRGLRLGVCFPVRISTLTQKCEGMIVNLSQQGARFECDGLFAIDQNLRIETLDPIPEFAEARAKVRWRRDRHYGVVFDDTFTLGDFARLVARLQAPGLLTD
ncbi:MAG: PilZ domain-containing protein [Pseudomonadota bacterium]